MEEGGKGVGECLEGEFDERSVGGSGGRSSGRSLGVVSVPSDSSVVRQEALGSSGLCGGLVMVLVLLAA